MAGFEKCECRYTSTGGYICAKHDWMKNTKTDITGTKVRTLMGDSRENEREVKIIDKKTLAGWSVLLSSPVSTGKDLWSFYARLTVYDPPPGLIHDSRVVIKWPEGSIGERWEVAKYDMQIVTEIIQNEPRPARPTAREIVERGSTVVPVELANELRRCIVDCPVCHTYLNMNDTQTRQLGVCSAECARKADMPRFVTKPESAKVAIREKSRLLWYANGQSEKSWTENAEEALFFTGIEGALACARGELAPVAELLGVAICRCVLDNPGDYFCQTHGSSFMKSFETDREFEMYMQSEKKKEEPLSFNKQMADRWRVRAHDAHGKQLWYLGKPYKGTEVRGTGRSLWTRHPLEAATFHSRDQATTEIRDTLMGVVGVVTVEVVRFRVIEEQGEAESFAFQVVGEET